MAYPDDKETFRRVVNQDLPAEPGNVVDENDQNLPADFLERLQDTLGYGIKMGYATVKAFFDYVVSQIALIAGKANKTGDTFSGNVHLNNEGAISPRLYLQESGYPNKEYIYSENGAIKIYFRERLECRSTEDIPSKFYLSRDALELNVKITLWNNEIEKAGNITLGTTFDFINTGLGRGIIVKTPDGTKSFRISVDNAGNVITAQV